MTLLSASIAGWSKTSAGLEIIFTSGQRNEIKMSPSDADENVRRLETKLVTDARGMRPTVASVVVLSWLPEGEGGQNLSRE